MNATPMTSARRLLSVALLALVALAWPAAARAELVVTTLEHGAWPASVAALQHNLQSQGTVLHVVVTDENGRRAPCGEYTLTFDEVGAAAFAMGACDVSTQATAVLLRQRGALFEHGDVIAHPLPVAITAVQTRTGSVSGGALSAGGSEVTCSVAVRPFLRDMETGAVVHLTPGRFVLRPLGAGVTAAIDSDGWNLTGSSAGLSIDYEVVDTQRREVVLRDRATLHCAATDLTVAAAARDAVCNEALPLPVGTTVSGSTEGASSRFVASCGAHAPGPDRVYELAVQTPSRVQIRLSSNYDGVLMLRAGCSPSALEIACNDDAPDTRHSFLDRTLAAGVYYVVVDGYSSQARGEYQLTVTLSPGDSSPDEASVQVVSSPSETLEMVCASTPVLPHNGTVHGATSGASDLVHAGCGSAAASPERVHMLVLEHRSHVRLNLSSSYDGVLYVRAGCGAGAELGCNDDDPDTRHSSLDLMLDAGTYYVFVDGYSTGHSGDYDLSVQVESQRVGFDARAGMTYAGSGTGYGSAFGFTAVSQVRVPAGRVGFLLGVQVGGAQYSNGVAAAPTSLNLLSVSFPFTIDYPLFDGSVHLYSVLDAGVARVRRSRASSAMGPAIESTHTGFALNLGEGIGVYPWRSFGLYAQLDYRVARVDADDGERLLSNAMAFSCGANTRF